MYLAPSHVSRRLFECDKRLEWVNHFPVGDKWVMTDPHEPLKFKINNPLSRIRHRKPTTRGRMCSQNHRISDGNNLYKFLISSRINEFTYIVLLYPILINNIRNTLSSISRKTSVLNSIFILVKVLKLIFGLGASLKMTHLKRLFSFSLKRLTSLLDGNKMLIY